MQQVALYKIILFCFVVMLCWDMTLCQWVIKWVASYCPHVQGLK